MPSGPVLWEVSKISRMRFLLPAAFLLTSFPHLTWAQEVTPAAEARTDTSSVAARSTADADSLLQESIAAAVSDSLKTLADSAAAADSISATQELQGSSDDVNQALKDVSRERTGLIKWGPISLAEEGWQRFRKKIDEKTGLKVGFAYTILYQDASDGTEPLSGASGDLDLFGKWDVYEAKRNRGSLGFYIEWRHQFGDITPQELGGQIGSQWPTTWAFGTRDFSLVQLWWEQYFLDNAARLTLGKIDPANYYNLNRSQNVNKQFINAAFSSNPALPWADNGLGFNLWVQPKDWVYLSVGASDGNGVTEGFNTGDPGAGELFSMIELGFSPKIAGKWKGNYRLGYWHYDAREEDGLPEDSGWALSIDQDLTKNVILFFRFATQDTTLTETEAVFASGLTVAGPLGQKDDLIGLGFAWGQPFGDFRDQYAIEMFYRLHLTAVLELSPAVTGIFSPTFDLGLPEVAVISFRARISL